MLSATEIMLLTDFKENKDHQWLNSINFNLSPAAPALPKLKFLLTGTYLSFLRGLVQIV